MRRIKRTVMLLFVCVFSEKSKLIIDHRGTRSKRKGQMSWVCMYIEKKRKKRRIKERNT